MAASKNPNFMVPGTFGRLVASGVGTTNGVADTATTVAHGALDTTGQPYTAGDLVCMAFPTATGKLVYQGAAPTASVIDIRSASVSAPYIWLLFYIAG